MDEEQDLGSLASCVFCKIVKGEQPGEILHEDELVLAFLDIAPIQPGHTLVIPREHHNSITTLPELTMGRMMTVAARLGKALMRSVDDGAGFNLFLANGMVAGQVVLHAHLHVIPRCPADGFAWGWRTQTYQSEAQKARIVAGVISRLEADRP